MKYDDGQDIRLWDRVFVWHSNPAHGVVVYSVDADEYSPQYPREAWAYLGKGIMVDTDQAGLIHFADEACELRLARRGGPLDAAELASLRRRGWEHAPGDWREGAGPSVRVGHVNPHGQVRLGHRGVRGTDHMQYSYRVVCSCCGHEYGANGSDMHERRCPKCQGGAPGLDF